MNTQDHWENIYTTKATENLGWYKSHLGTSLDWIQGLKMALDVPIIDVGGGVCTLVDDLLEKGHQNLTVLDVSEKALATAKVRLGQNSDQVRWLTADITSVKLPINHYELWHDRAVLHFLTLPDDQHKYRDTLYQALKPRGHLIVGVFAPEAPPKCSGLPVQRYTQEQMEILLGEGFELVKAKKELHNTPGGVEQMYLYCHFCKKG